MLSDKAYRGAAKLHGEDFGLYSFNDDGHVPAHLFVPDEDVGATPAAILRSTGFTTTKLYQTFMAMAKKMDGRWVAMFFPVKHMTEYVIHNMEVLDRMVGFNVVTRRLRGDEEIRIEPFDSFLTMLALRYKDD